ncbi:MAG: TetR/AcrR family transcriptional regulator [Myxococcota bacterium]
MSQYRSNLRWIRTPQQARSQETLERILDAAEVLISDKGVDDTSVAEVARRAGSSVGAFYTRFRDKDGLFYALYDRYLEQAMATADDALDPARWQGIGVREMLDSVVRFLVEIYRDRRGLMRAFVLRNHTDPEFGARQERLSHYVSDKLGALLLARSEQIRHPDPARAAAFGLILCFASIESAVLFGEVRSGSLSLSDEDLASELVRAFVAYLGIDPSPDAASPDDSPGPRAGDTAKEPS